MPLSVSAATTDVVESSNTYTDEYGEWTYEPTDNGDGYKITGYDKSMTDIEIPHVIDNLPVVEIKDKMFLRCSSLTSVTIPNSITTIGNSAFYGCSNLTSVTLSDRVTAIGNFTFANCSSLTNITIPDNVMTLNTPIFYGCNNLTDIEVSANNKKYSSINGILFDKTQSELIRYPAGKLSSNYTIPNSVTTIYDSAFCECKNLLNITIPDSVTTIVAYAFHGCSITDITIPNSVTTIGSYVFSNCSSLSEITLPKSVKKIGEYAFEDCSSLTSVTIPNSVKTIGSYAFSNCTSLSNVYYTGSESEWNSILINKGNSCLTNATIHYNYTPPITGDISGDGILAVNDVIFVLKNIVGNQELTAEQLALADVSDDGKLTILDAILLQKLVLEMV